MYFPQNPLFDLDPILQSITDPTARGLLLADYDHDLSEHERLLGYRWDIVFTGAHATPTESDVHAPCSPNAPAPRTCASTSICEASGRRCSYVSAHTR